MCNNFFLLKLFSLFSLAVAASASGEAANLTNVQFTSPPSSISYSQQGFGVGWDIQKQSGTSMLEADFKCFFDELQMFFSESSFESSLFKKNIDVYKLRLSAILCQARDIAFENTPVARQISFCTRTFFEMAHAAHMIEHHDLMATEASSLLTYVVDLHIRLFALHDSYGNLNLNLMRPLESINDFQQELNCWHDEFSRLSNVPLEIQLLFKDRVKKAERTMKVLLEQALQNRQST